MWGERTVAEFAVDNAATWSTMNRTEAVTWLKGAPYRWTNTRANVGTAAHAAVEAHLRGGYGDPVDVDTELVPFVAAAVDFLNVTAAVPLHVEATVFNDTLKYAGTGDLFAAVEWDGAEHVAVIDWKTKQVGKDLFPETALQLSALAGADWIGVPDGADGLKLPVPECTLGLAVALYDNATWKAWPVDLTAHQVRLFRTFTALRTMHHWTANVASTIFHDPIVGNRKAPNAKGGN